MNKKPCISRKDQAKLTQKKIFDTTLVLINKKGYQKVTIREICQTAQISIGTFYLYFSSKDDILLEIYNKLDSRLDFPEYDHTMSKSNLICSYFEIYLNNMVSMFDKSLLREILRISLSNGTNEFLSPERPMIQSVRKLLSDEAQNNNLLIDDSPEIICEKIHLFVQSYLFHWLTDNNLGTNFLTTVCIEDLKTFLTLYLK